MYRRSTPTKKERNKQTNKIERRLFEQEDKEIVKKVRHSKYSTIHPEQTAGCAVHVI